MKLEIERKFLVKKKPNLNGIAPVQQERFYLFQGQDIELRIQTKNDYFELERKTNQGEYSRDSQKLALSKTEYETLKKIGQNKTLRDSYSITKKPNVKLKIYHGAHEGLIRAEIEFDSIEDAKRFQPFDWMGTEITATPLGRDT